LAGGEKAPPKKKKKKKQTKIFFFAKKAGERRQRRNSGGRQADGVGLLGKSSPSRAASLIGRPPDRSSKWEGRVEAAAGLFDRLGFEADCVDAFIM